MDVEISEAGVYTVLYEGPVLDLHSASKFLGDLHQMFERIALSSLLSDSSTANHLIDALQTGVVPNQLTSATDLETMQLRRVMRRIATVGMIRPKMIQELLSIDPLIKMNVTRVNIGSWEQDLVVVASSIFANSDVRAVLAGLSSNVIHGIMRAGIDKVVKATSTRTRAGTQETETTTINPNLHLEGTSLDPFDIGDNLADIVGTLIQSGGEKAQTLTIKHKSGDSVSEVQVRLR